MFVILQYLLPWKRLSDRLTDTNFMGLWSTDPAWARAANQRGMSRAHDNRVIEPPPSAAPPPPHCLTLHLWGSQRLRVCAVLSAPVLSDQSRTQMQSGG